MDRFPGLYSIECRKSCKVADIINTHGFEWNWSCDVSNVGLSQELDQLRAIVGLFVPGALCDSWMCELDSTGIFSTKSFRANLI